MNHTEEEEEPPDAGGALAELQKKNEDLVEQLRSQQQLQGELQAQLHESQRSCAQLRTQVRRLLTCVMGTLVSRDLRVLTSFGGGPVCSSPLQILVYEGEMARAQGQLEAEMQNLEEEKNRVIEEAFIRAESEMKAVHENLAGQTRCDWLSLLASALRLAEPGALLLQGYV